MAAGNGQFKPGRGLSAQAFQAIVETSVSPYVVVDSDGIVVWTGTSVIDLLGEHADAYVGRHFLDIIHPSSHEAAIAAFSAFVGESASESWIGPPMVLDLVAADGSMVACEVSATQATSLGMDGAVLHVRRSRGTPLLYEAVDSLASGAPIDTVLGRLAQLCEHDTPGSSVVIGRGWDGARFRWCAPDTARLPALDRPGPSPWRDAMTSGEVRGGGDLADDYPSLAEEASLAGFATCWVMPITVGDDVGPTAALLLWRQQPGGALPHRTTTAQRVTRLVAFAIESHRNLVHLREAARTDELTGLDNRFAQRTTLDALLQRSTGGQTTALFFCDLDDFKPVNDEYGHDFGDRVLAIVAERLREAVRDDDHVARWGGDEFVVTCSGRDRSELEGLAERLIETVRKPINLDGRRLRVGLSVGVAVTEGRTDADDLLRAADDALRVAKAAGKNQWRAATVA